MRMTVRGWSRNMGETELLNIDLSEYRVSRDQRKVLRWDTPALFKDFGSTEVHWARDLKLTGSYRVEVKFTHEDVLKLFKSTFGSELDVDLLEKHGFTVSEELKKAVLRTVKLPELTLGQLTSMMAPATVADAATPTAEVKPFTRRF